MTNLEIVKEIAKGYNNLDTSIIETLADKIPCNKKTF
jgi:hypothetical protein